MKSARLSLAALTLGILLSLIASTSHAQLQRIELRVDGLACPFCAYGLEKNLKALKGLDSIKIDLDGGVATIIPKKGKAISLDRMAKAVREAGFTPKDTKVIANGRIVPVDALADDPEATKQIAQIKQVARAQGIDLPTATYALVIDEPRQVFLLLRGDKDALRKQYDQAVAASSAKQLVAVTGTIPSIKKGVDEVPAVMVVDKVQTEVDGG